MSQTSAQNDAQVPVAAGYDLTKLYSTVLVCVQKRGKIVGKKGEGKCMRYTYVYVWAQ